MLLVTKSSFAQEKPDFSGQPADSTGKPSFTKVEDLQVDDTVFIRDSESLRPEKIIEKRWVEEPIEVYNLTVGGDQTFFANGLAVHNKGYLARVYFYWDVNMDGYHQEVEPIVTADRSLVDWMETNGTPAELGEAYFHYIGSWRDYYDEKDRSVGIYYNRNDTRSINDGGIVSIYDETVAGATMPSRWHEGGTVAFPFGQTKRDAEFRVGGIHFKDYDTGANRPVYSYGTYCEERECGGDDKTFCRYWTAKRESLPWNDERYNLNAPIGFILPPGTRLPETKPLYRIYRSGRYQGDYITADQGAITAFGLDGTAGTSYGSANPLGAIGFAYETQQPGTYPLFLIRKLFRYEGRTYYDYMTARGEGDRDWLIDEANMGYENPPGGPYIIGYVYPPVEWGWGADMPGNITGFQRYHADYHGMNDYADIKSPTPYYTDLKPERDFSISESGEFPNTGTSSDRGLMVQAAEFTVDYSGAYYFGKFPSAGGDGSAVIYKKDPETSLSPAPVLTLCHEDARDGNTCEQRCRSDRPKPYPWVYEPEAFGFSGDYVCTASERKSLYRNDAAHGRCSLQTGQTYVMITYATGGGWAGTRKWAWPFLMPLSARLKTTVPDAPYPVAAIPLVKKVPTGTIRARVWDESGGTSCTFDPNDGVNGLPVLLTGPDLYSESGQTGDDGTGIKSFTVPAADGYQLEIDLSDTDYSIAPHFTSCGVSGVVCMLDTYSAYMDVDGIQRLRVTTDGKVWGWYMEAGDEDWTVQGSASGHDLASHYLFSQAGGPCAKKATITDINIGEEETANFDLPVALQSGTISGRAWQEATIGNCTDDGEAGEVLVNISIEDSSGMEVYSTTGTSFSYAAVPGTYTVKATQATGDYYIDSICGFGQSGNQWSKTVFLSAEESEVVGFPFLPYGSITGQVFKTAAYGSCDTSTPITESGWEITCNTVPVRHDSVSQFTCVDSGGNDHLELGGYGLDLTSVPSGLSESCWLPGASFNLTSLNPKGTSQVVLSQSSSAWFQVTGGDVHADGGGIVDPIPVTCIGDPECEPYFFNLSGSNLSWYSTLDSESAVTNPEVGSGGAVGGTATFAASQYGNGLLVDSSGEYVSFPASDNFNSQKGVVEFWYKNEEAPAEWGKFFCSDDTQVGNIQLCRAGADRTIRFEVYDSEGKKINEWVDTNVDLFDGAWHHVKLSYDEETDSPELWLDFEKETRDTTAAWDTVTAQANIYIGNRINDQDRDIGGIIDEFRVYEESTSVSSGELGVLSRASGSVSLGDVNYPENLSEPGQPKWRALSGSFDGVRSDYHFYHRQLEREIEEWAGSPQEGVWETTTAGDLVIGGAGWGGLTDKIVLLHDGNILVDGEITVDSGGSLVVIASGKISISPDIENVHGIYIAESIETGNGYEKLEFEGSLIGWGSVALQRDLDSDPGGRQNYNTPAEIITYRPDIVINAHSSLKQPAYRWEEVSP